MLHEGQGLWPLQLLMRGVLKIWVSDECLMLANGEYGYMVRGSKCLNTHGMSLQPWRIDGMVD